MELIAVMILSGLLPIFTIGGFVVGYNINAPKKLFHHTKKHQPTEDEAMLERIDKATV